jgi:Arc/MetJ-type ribon-helix-helix transcriptional regulator
MEKIHKNPYKKGLGKKWKILYVNLSREDAEKLKGLITSGKYINQADAIRHLIRKESEELDKRKYNEGHLS